MRVVPSASRMAATVKPSGEAASSPAATTRRLIDRLGCEVGAVALDDEAPADQLADDLPVGAGRLGVGRRPRGGPQRGEPGVGGQALEGGGPGGAARRPGPARVHDDLSRRAAGARPAGARQRGDVEAVVAGVAGRPRRRALVAARAPGATTHRSPTVAGRRTPVSRSSSSTSTQPRSATTRSTERRRPGLGRGQRPAPRRGPRRRRRSRTGRSPGGRSDRRAAGAAATGRCSRTRPSPPGGEGVGAEHPQPDRVLARADVELVGAPPGHVVVEGGEHVRGRRRRPGRGPLSGPDHGVAPDDLVVG